MQVTTQYIISAGEISSFSTDWVINGVIPFPRICFPRYRIIITVSGTIRKQSESLGRWTHWHSIYIIYYSRYPRAVISHRMEFAMRVRVETLFSWYRIRFFRYITPLHEFLYVLHIIIYSTVQNWTDLVLISFWLFYEGYENTTLTRLDYTGWEFDSS